MNAAAPNIDPSALPSGLTAQPAAEALRQIGRAMGLESAPVGHLADLPPWTPDEADAFEQFLAEICE